MAFDFIKKVFSFGRKAEDEKPEAAAPAPEQPAVAPYVGLEQEAPLAEPAPAPETAAPNLPATEALPPIREPDPIPAAPLREEVAPEPSSIPEPGAAEPVAPTAPAGVAMVPEPDGQPAPAAEILPPIRVADPVPALPVEAEIAPELAVPEPPPPAEAEPVGTDFAPEPVVAEVAAPPEPAPVAVEPPPVDMPQVATPAAAELAPDRPTEPEFLPQLSLPEPAPVAVEPPPFDSRQVTAPAPAETLSEPAPAAHEPVEPTPVAVEPPPLEAVQVPPPAAAPVPVAPTPPSGKVIVAKKVEARVEPAVPAPAARPSWFQRMREGLSRSSRELSSSIASVFTKKKLDEETLQDLEDVLIRADLGVETALRITDTLASTRLGRDVSEAEVRAVMATEIEKVLSPVARPLELDLSHKPHVVLVVGVNGTGKTTTIGKLAAKLHEGGLKVMLAAGDTFRAAAIEQLKIWGERTGSPVISSRLGADAAGLAYDAFVQAKEAGSDVLIVDTAGRLQNKAELMAELEKVVRVLGKLDPEAPHTVLQTVDATTGQNALNQVEIFRNVAGVNGLVMTKLDGTARGGILVAIAAKHKLPVYFIGVGEQVDDLEPFSASDFARAIAGVQ